MCRALQVVNTRLVIGNDYSIVLVSYVVLGCPTSGSILAKRTRWRFAQVLNLQTSSPLCPFLLSAEV
jgi:hypothetical protein